jgi:anti-anti-sigma factor
MNVNVGTGPISGDTPIELSVQIAGRVITVAGEIDVSNVDSLRDAILDTAATEDLIVVDLTDVTYADSSTIGLMMTMTRDLATKRYSLRIVAPSGGRPRRVFALTGVEASLSLYEALEDALNADR